MSESESGSASASSDLSDSELEPRSNKYYLALQSGKLQVNKSDGTLKCPFCAGKKKQSFLHKDLLQHATGIAASPARKFSLKATHLALARFLTPDPAPQPHAPAPDPATDRADLFVWPWTGILVNTHVPDFQSQLRTFDPVDVQTVGDRAVIMFDKDMKGYKDAMKFENHFKRKGVGNGMYGWVAREKDYNEEGPVGEVIRLHGDLRSYADVANDQVREAGKVIGKFASEIEVQNSVLQELESKCNQATMSIERVMAQRQQLQQNYNRDMRNLHLDAQDNVRRILHENEKLKLELDSKKKLLDVRSKELEKLETQNESEKGEVHAEKEKAALENTSLQLATMVQKKADEDVLKLVEDQKREKETALKKILQLERQLDQKQQLELEIEQLKGKLMVMKHLEGEEDTDMQKKMEELNEKLEEEKEHLEELNNTLISKQRESNDELQEARKKLIAGLDDMLTGKTIIGIKRMGELDEKPFELACKKRYKFEADTKAAELISYWQEELKDPAWHPFKVTEMNGIMKEEIDKDDEKLQKLWVELGDDVCNAVKTALWEMNEYNPSGRYTIPELWNFKENRKASMREVVQYILKQWKIYKRKKVG